MQFFFTPSLYWVHPGADGVLLSAIRHIHHQDRKKHRLNSIKRIGIPPHLYAKPISFGLAGNASCELVIDASAKNALGLRNRDLDIAFLSLIEYARDSSDYSILPNVAVASDHPNGTIVLHFNEGLESIKTIAINPSSSAEAVLAKIILAEEFDLTPSFVPVLGTVDEMLSKADSALLVGDAAFLSTERHPQNLDLIELWQELTDRPYIHGVWCARSENISDGVVTLFHNAKKNGVDNLAKIGEDAVIAFGGITSSLAVADYLQSFRYDFTKNEIDGMEELLKYAYYHGAIPDVPEINVFGKDAGHDELPPNFSVN